MFFVISHIRLEEGRVKAQKDGVLLACHELNRKFLVPLLLESVHKYQLFDQFQATVKGNMHHLRGYYTSIINYYHQLITK